MRAVVMEAVCEEVNGGYSGFFSEVGGGAGVKAL